MQPETYYQPQVGPMLKVSSRSSASSVAGAIAGMIKDGLIVEIQAIGAGAVNQAVKAIAISRSFLSPSLIEIACIPSFADVEIGGEQRTAIRFSVRPISVNTIVPFQLTDDSDEVSDEQIARDSLLI